MSRKEGLTYAFSLATRIRTGLLLLGRGAEDLALIMTVCRFHTVSATTVVIVSWLRGFLTDLMTECHAYY
jgi:hypothetical protein